MNRKEPSAELTSRQNAEDVRALALLLPGGSVASHRGPTKPAMSLAFAERARRVTDVCRFEVRGGSHTLLGRAPDVWSVTTDFMLSTLGCRELPAPLLDALSEKGDLRTTLAVGYGR